MVSTAGATHEVPAIYSYQCDMNTGAVMEARILWETPPIKKLKNAGIAIDAHHNHVSAQVSYSR